MILLFIGRIVKICIDFLQQFIIRAWCARPLCWIRCGIYRLHVVINSFQRIRALSVKMERNICTRHTIQRLECIAISISCIFPCTSIILRVKRRLAELSRYFRVVFCRNRCNSSPVPTTSVLERQCVCFSREIHIHNRGIIRSNGDRIGTLEGKIIPLCKAPWQGRIV